MVEKLINTNTHFSDNIISRKELEVVPGVIKCCIGYIQVKLQVYDRTSAVSFVLVAYCFLLHSVFTSKGCMKEGALDYSVKEVKDTC